LLRRNRDFMSQVVAWERFPQRDASSLPFPADMAPALSQALQRRGISRLYTHQDAAISAVANRDDVVVATATASGKSLCYTIPVL